MAFNERFFLESPNILASVAPEFADLARTVKVIDVPASTGGLVLRVLMNADLDKAVGLLSAPGSAEEGRSDVRGNAHGWTSPSAPNEQHRWRIQVAERIAAEADVERFGLKAMWLVGSSKDGTAGPASDLDLVLHTDDDPVKREALATWLDGWSLCLAEMNTLRTGTRAKGLLDVHFLSDSDFSRSTGWAAKVKAVKDPARALPLCGTKKSAPVSDEERDA